VLCGRFAALAGAPVPGRQAAPLRAAVHHAAAGAAAEAMALWIERHLDPAQVVIAPLTRHAAAWLGPGMLGIAWLRGSGGDA
jgi:fatty acid-binding protein DegV